MTWWHHTNVLQLPKVSTRFGLGIADLCCPKWAVRLRSRLADATKGHSDMIRKALKFSDGQKLAMTLGGAITAVALRRYGGDYFTLSGVLLQPAVLLPALFFGRAHGFVALFLALIGFWFFVTVPQNSFEVHALKDALNIIGLFLMGLFNIAVADFAHHTFLRAAKLADREKEQSDLVIRELNHRMRNMLTVTRSVVTQTLAKATDIQKARSQISRQLETLIGAYDLVVKEGSPPIKHLIETQAAARQLKKRLHLQGEDIEADPQAAVTLALIFHEMSTNAMKHGAWSNDAGMVTVDIKRYGGDICLTWKERGGPPVKPPSLDGRGFGSYLIPRALSALHGVVDTIPDIDGYRYEVCVPVQSIKPEMV